MSNYNAQLQSNNTSLRGLIQTVNNLSSGAGQAYSENEDALLNRTLSNYTNSVITYVQSHAFNHCEKLEKISLPICQETERLAFQCCTRLTEVNLPQCSILGYGAFGSCHGLSNIAMKECTVIGGHAFNACYSLTSISFPKCSFIGSLAFAYTKINHATFPLCEYIDDRTFGQCTELKFAEFGKTSFIGSQTFYGCRNLSDIRLPGSQVCVLSNSNAFTSTPYKGYSSYFNGTPHIYVPASLISNYQQATNWVYFSSYFSAIENAPITFTIDDQKFCADADMTWEQWIGSEYDYLHTLKIKNGSVCCNICNKEIESIHYDPVWGAEFGEVNANSPIKYYESYYVTYCPESRHKYFKLDGIKYPMTPGMTWKEWIESEYNTHPTISLNSDNNVVCSTCGGWLEPDFGSSSEMWDEPYYTGSDIIGQSMPDSAESNLLFSLNSHKDCYKTNFFINNRKYTTTKGATWSQWFESNYFEDSANFLTKRSTLSCRECGAVLSYMQEDNDGLVSAAMADEAIIAKERYDACKCNGSRFYIDGKPYWFVQGMTWGEWVDGYNNTAGWSYDSEGIIQRREDDTLYELFDDRDHDYNIYSDSTIVANDNYYSGKVGEFDPL